MSTQGKQKPVKKNRKVTMTDKRTKRYIKKCRQRSITHHDYILRRANYQCEICGWGNRDLNCLHIHHIQTLKTMYGGLISPGMIENDYFIDMDFEHANLTALCPNCHRLVHAFMNAKGDKHRHQIFKEIGKYYSSDHAHLFIDVATTKIFHDRYRISLESQIEKTDKKLQQINEKEI